MVKVSGKINFEFKVLKSHIILTQSLWGETGGAGAREKGYGRRERKERRAGVFRGQRRKQETTLIKG